MRATKPAWVEHTGEKKNKCPIYSISVHPDGTRLATGGQDNKVKIWNTLPILDKDAEDNEANHKLLCTMSAHTGPVLTVRWAHHGRYLATGSDDTVVMIWDLDPSGGGRLWGSDEVNVENWKPLRRVVGHAADVVDCAWSRDDSMLASVGLDSVVNIWDGLNFEKLRTLTAHGGFVKGVCWDPVGEFLATQSDDKTVKIWKTDDWSLVQTVSKPFTMSPQSTFFRRLSWSPDGAFIAASNAMNGPVFVAAVIEREGWSHEISFVGHENTIQVAAFNPRLFLLPGDAASRATASTMVALGADDFNISIWRNIYHQPLVVIKDVFARQAHDLCWSNDGLVLYGCSADGTIVAVKFDPEEFPELAKPEATEVVLGEYDFRPKRTRVNPLALSAASAPMTTQIGFPAARAGGEEQVNVIIPRKGKPKDTRRVALSGSNGLGGGGTDLGGRAPLQRPVASPLGQSGAIEAFAAAASSSLSHSLSASDATAQMFNHRHSAFNGHDSGDMDTFMAARSKRRAGVAFDDDYGGGRGRTPTGRSMGTGAAIGPVEDIRAPRVAIASTSGGKTLPISRIQTVITATQVDIPQAQAGKIVAENKDDRGSGGVYKVTFIKDTAGGESWVDFTSTPVLAVVATSRFCAAGMEDGTVKVYSTDGVLRSSIKLAAPCSEMKGSKDMLLLVTADCQVRVIDTKRGKNVFPPTSLAHLLDPPPTSTSTAPLEIRQVSVEANGCPVVITSEPAAYAYHSDLEAWTLIASKGGDDPVLAGVLKSPAGVLSRIEMAVEGQSRPHGHRGGSGAGSGAGPGVEWRDEVKVIQVYETRRTAAKLLGLKEEWRLWTRELGKWLGQKELYTQLRDVVDDLVGPVYHHAASTKWEPMVLGISKRDVAREVLTTIIATGETSASGSGAGVGTGSIVRWAKGRINELDEVRAEEWTWA